MPGHISRRLPGIDQACQKILRCIALDDIRCDGDENLWPNGEDRVDYCNITIVSVSVDGVYTNSCILELLSAKK